MESPVSMDCFSASRAVAVLLVLSPDETTCTSYPARICHTSGLYPPASILYDTVVSECIVVIIRCRCVRIVVVDVGWVVVYPLGNEWISHSSKIVFFFFGVTSWMAVSSPWLPRWSPLIFAYTTRLPPVCLPAPSVPYLHQTKHTCRS
jgi:hypothetical protein